HPPRIVDKVRLMKRIGIINGTAECDGRKRSLRARESIHEVAEGREAAARGKRQRSLSVERNELLGELPHHIRSGADRVPAVGIGDRVLQLIVVEDSTLREERGDQTAEYPNSGDRSAGEQELRPKVERRRILGSEQHVEPS